MLQGNRLMREQTDKGLLTTQREPSQPLYEYLGNAITQKNVMLQQRIYYSYEQRLPCEHTCLLLIHSIIYLYLGIFLIYNKNSLFAVGTRRKNNSLTFNYLS